MTPPVYYPPHNRQKTTTTKAIIRRKGSTIAMSYKNIGDYGIIGDLHTIALVGLDGSIDWCCLPRFDAPSVFGAILDHKAGGHFRIAPVEAGNARQMYLPETNILLTRFLQNDGDRPASRIPRICRHRIRRRQGVRIRGHQVDQSPAGTRCR